MGRKLTSIDVLESVFCTPFATARLFRPPGGGGREGGGISDGATSWDEEGCFDGSTCGEAL